MPEPPGRREASKQAVRTALLTAAKELFAERGFEHTTVRDIASAANVTERTFYRYFEGKEGLIGEEFRSWLRVLREAIIARPADESPVLAVQRALLEVGEQVAAGSGPMPLWLFSHGPPVPRLLRSAPRPLLQLETAIAEAVLARRTEPAAADTQAQFRAQVTSRVAVAALRSAMIEHRGRRASGQAESGQAESGRAALSPPVHLLATAFEIISQDWHASPAAT